jgi:hypothetical protein
MGMKNRLDGKQQVVDPAMERLLVIAWETLEEVEVVVVLIRQQLLTQLIHLVLQVVVDQAHHLVVYQMSMISKLELVYHSLVKGLYPINILETLHSVKDFVTRKEINVMVLDSHGALV